MDTNEWVALKDSISKDHIRVEKILFAVEFMCMFSEKNADIERKY